MSQEALRTHWREVIGGFLKIGAMSYGGPAIMGLMQAEFSFMGKAQGGGSGWVLLSYSHRDQKLGNQWAADHTCNLAGATPILALDRYEHSYHMDYGAKAAAYVDASLNNINWANIARLYEESCK